MRACRILLTALALAAGSGCDRRRDVGPVVASAIGAPATLRDFSRQSGSTPDRLLADSVAQGLVRFDAAGGVEPGLAARWIVIDDGRTYIFRLRRAQWPDGRRVTARDVVRALRRQIASGSHNPLAPYLSAVDRVIAMTPNVVEIDLSRSRPDLLKLFAQPELAIRPPRGVGGSGSMHVIAGSGTAPLLAPTVDPDRAADEQRAATPEDAVRLIGERAAAAIVRFKAKRSDLVAGGTIDDWPLLRAAEIAPTAIRRDPAAGLFGLAVVDRSGFLAESANRAAVAGAIDRAALTAAFARNWPPAEQILPERLDSAAPPARPIWAGITLPDRRILARTAVSAWRRTHSGNVSLRLALPAGPGGTILWARLAADLIAVGIRPVRVAPDAPADLGLIDRVAPYDSARWYLASACVRCGGAAAEAIEAARLAPTLADRAEAIGRADAALVADGGFIPIARPFRWSLVGQRLRAWQPNVRAWHPLNRLRNTPT